MALASLTQNSLLNRIVIRFVGVLSLATKRLTLAFLGLRAILASYGKFGGFEFLLCWIILVKEVFSHSGPVITDREFKPIYP